MLYLWVFFSFSTSIFHHMYLVHPVSESRGSPGHDTGGGGAGHHFSNKGCKNTAKHSCMTSCSVK